MTAVVTHGEAETEALGSALAPLLVPGDVVVLAGELGAGKTVFARGIARGLGVDGPVTSPTFTLAHEYAGRLRMVHVDVYRLERVHELLDLGLDDDADDGVLVVEWGDAVAAGLAPERLEVRLDPGPDDAPDERRVTMTPVGDSWVERLGPGLEAAVMQILAFDTATDVVGVAVGRDGAVLAESRLDAGRLHAEQLVPAIRDVAERAGVALADLDAIAVGLGPGRFTGLRVGVTTAKVLAFALGIPVVGVPSLDLVAHPLQQVGRETVVVIDARRHEVFWARYRPGGLDRVDPIAVDPPAEVVARLAGEPANRIVAGDGLARYGDLFAALPGAELAGAGHAPPSPGALIELGTARVARGDVARPEAVVPLYVRESDAVINWQGIR